MVNGTKWSNNEQNTRNSKKNEKNVTRSGLSELKRHRQKVSITGRPSIHTMEENTGNRGTAMEMEMDKMVLEARVREGEEAVILMTDETTADDGTALTMTMLRLEMHNHVANEERGSVEAFSGFANFCY